MAALQVISGPRICFVKLTALAVWFYKFGLSALKNWEFTHINPNFWLILKQQNNCNTKPMFPHGCQQSTVPEQDLSHVNGPCALGFAKSSETSFTLGSSISCHFLFFSWPASLNYIIYSESICILILYSRAKSLKKWGEMIWKRWV